MESIYKFRKDFIKVEHDLEASYRNIESLVSELGHERFKFRRLEEEYARLKQEESAKDTELFAVRDSPASSTLELRLDLVEERIYTYSKRKTVNSTRTNAFRIMKDIVNPRLQAGYKAHPLKDSWVSEKLGLTGNQIKKSKWTLSQAGVLKLWQSSVNIPGKERNALWMVPWKYVWSYVDPEQY